MLTILFNKIKIDGHSSILSFVSMIAVGSWQVMYLVEQDSRCRRALDSHQAGMSANTAGIYSAFCAPFTPRLPLRPDSCFGCVLFCRRQADHPVLPCRGAVVRRQNPQQWSGPVVWYCWRHRWQLVLLPRSQTQSERIPMQHVR